MTETPVTEETNTDEPTVTPLPVEEQVGVSEETKKAGSSSQREDNRAAKDPKVK